MCNECEISEIYTHNGKFFDFALEYGSPTIIDYRYLDREIIVPIGGAVEIGDVKKKNEVKSVYELRSIFKELVWDVQQLLCQSLLKKYAPNIEETQLNQLRQDLNAYFKNYYCKDEDTEFLVNQLVFDILYSNYGEVDIHEEITLLEYCAKHFHYFSGDKWERYNQTEDLQTVSVGDKETAFKMMDRQLKRTIGVMSKPEIEKVYPHFAIGFQQDIVEFLAKNKLWPKMLLDQLFLDGNTSLITSRQYRRNFVIERKADYEKFAAEFNAYDKYVEEVIAPRRYDNIDKEYFRQSMDFYFLEVHSRLDFMYKFAETLEVLENKNEGSSNLLKIRFLIEPYSVYAYCPLVVPDEKGDTHLEFVIEKREYFPIMLTEKSSKRTLLDILREPDDNPFLEDNAINFCRAKTLELFKYHHVFVSDNYKEISDFIRNNYDILSYHEKNKIWKVLKNKPTAAQKRSIKTIEMINNYLFPNVYPMNRSEWRKSNKNNAAAISEKHEKIDEAKVKELKDEDYFTLFGMDKGTFEKILGILESAYKESHTSGGRPASLSVLKRLAVTIEYRRNKRSMGNIACDYGVSKSRINDAIKWVEKTVTESESGASLSEAFYSGRS